MKIAIANGREMKNRKIKSRVKLMASDTIIHAIRWPV